MRILILSLVALTLGAQSYEFQGWAENGTVSGATTGYYDKVLPTNNKPSGTFWPQVGPLNSFIDPVGTRSWIFADEYSYHGYSSRTTVSANGTYGYTVTSPGAVYKVYNIKTGALVSTVPGGPDSPLNTIQWSALHDTRMYAISSNKQVQMYDVLTGVWTTLVTFDGTGGRPNLTIENGGTADGSSDDHFAFFSETDKQVCVIDLETAGYPHTCYDFTSLALPSSVDNVILSKGVSSLTGRRYLLMQKGDFATVHMYYTTIAGGITFSHQWECWQSVEAECVSSGTGGDEDGIWEAGERYTRGEHNDTGFTSDGRQFMLRSCDTGSKRALCLFWLDLETAATIPGNVTEIRRMAATSITTRNWPNSVHIGCAKLVPVCIQSSWVSWYNGGDPASGTSYVSRPLATAAEPYQAYASGWLVEAIYNGDDRFRMVAHTRGQLWSGGDSYYSLPRASISANGNIVSYDTNLGSTTGADLRVVYAHIGSDPQKALRITNKTATTATLRYVAPSVTACAVTVDNSSDFASPVSGFSAVSDVPAGKNERSMALTGLTTETTYYVRVNCGKNADTSFSTH